MKHSTLKKIEHTTFIILIISILLLFSQLRAFKQDTEHRVAVLENKLNFSNLYENNNTINYQ